LYHTSGGKAKKREDPGHTGREGPVQPGSVEKGKEK